MNPLRSVAAPSPRRRLRLWLVCFALAALVACGAPSGTEGGEVDLQPPREVTARSVPGGIEVAWTDTSRNEAGFRVYRQNTTEPASDFTVVGSTPPDATRYTDTDVEPGAAYRYQVAAFGPAGTVGERGEQAGPATEPRASAEIVVTVAGDGRVVGDGGFTCSDRCTLEVDAGSSVTLEAVAADGSGFAGWSDGCAEAAGALRCTLTPGGDGAVGATFGRYVLRLELDGDGEGYFSVFRPDTEDLVCRSDCGVAYDSPLDFATVTYRSEGTPTQLGPWGGACADAAEADYCLIGVDGPVVVTKVWRRAPIARSDAYRTPEDTALDIAAAAGVLTNDEDSPGDTLVAELITAPEHGALELASDGGFRYTPNPDFSGDDAFTYRVEDAFGNTSASTRVSLTVEPTDDTPVARSATITLDEDGRATFALEGLDPDGDPVSFAVLDAPRNGRLVGPGDGAEVTYVPDPEFSGEDAFTFTASADGRTSAAATVTLRVQAVNDPPTARDGSLALDEDGSATLDLASLVGDVDDPDDALRFEIVEAPAKGTIASEADDGVVRFQGDSDAVGNDRFRFRVTDPAGASAEAAVAVTLRPVNDPPVFGLPSRTVRLDGPDPGPQAIADFARGIGAGGGPDEADQQLSFALERLDAEPPALDFDTAPELSPDGTLAFDPRGPGRARFRATLRDDGGTANGGRDRSEPVEFTLVVDPVATVAFTGAGSGSVESSPAGLRCSATCSRVFPLGSVVELTPRPDAGSRFVVWLGAGSGNPTRTLMMDGNRRVTVAFGSGEAAPLELSVDLEGRGEGRVESAPAGIDCGDDCDQSFEPGTQVTLSAEAGPGSRFVGWEGDCTGRTCSLSMTEPRSVTAIFGRGNGDDDDDEDDGDDDDLVGAGW